MKLSRAILVLFMASFVLLTALLPCRGTEKANEEKANGDANSIWTQYERRGPRPKRWELTDEEIDRIMKSLDEKKAKEIAKLRETDPRKFHDELRNQARKEFEKVIRERIDAWRKKSQAEFLEWLGKEYTHQAGELNKLKREDPDLYNKKFDLVWNTYRRIYEIWRRNPELGQVLKEDTALKKRRDELLTKFKNTKDSKQKKHLLGQLEDAVSARFDLIVRRKQIAYKQLQKRLEELQKKIQESRDEMGRWRSKKFKTDNVKERIKDLLDPNFKWD